MARFEQHETTLPPGGTLLLYTDGVSDARPPTRAWNGWACPALKSCSPALPPSRRAASSPTCCAACPPSAGATFTTTSP